MKYQVTFEIEGQNEDEVVRVAQKLVEGRPAKVLYVTREEPATKQVHVYSDAYSQEPGGEKWRRLGTANYNLEVLTRKP